MDLVYHYTSPEAMLSILQSKALRFSDCEFMNDPEEIAYCYRLYDKAWIEACREAGIPEERINYAVTSQASPYECESSISEELGFGVAARYYSFSTCLDADNLAMWSCYACGDGRTGYALGFDAESLVRAIDSNASSCSELGIYFESQHGEVCYSEKEQSEKVTHLIKGHLLERRAISERRRCPVDYVVATEIARSNHWARVSALAPFIKRSGFAHEREYRFVLRLGQSSMDSAEKYGGDSKPAATLGWRLSSSGVLVPYYELSLGQAFSRALREIRIMQSGDSRIAISGMRRLLDSLGYQQVVVQETNVQIRVF